MNKSQVLARMNAVRASELEASMKKGWRAAVPWKICEPRSSWRVKGEDLPSIPGRALGEGEAADAPGSQP